MNYRLLWSTLLLCLFLPWKLGAVPSTMNYQGRISLTYGAQVADGPYNPVFNIYHQASGGLADWTETDAVNTKNGLFSVVLGQSQALSSLPGDQQYWLEVVWAGQTMSPRQPLTSAPYALWAGSVDLPITGTTSSVGAAISVTNTTGPGMVGVGNNGVVGKGSVIGAKGEATANNATGLYGDYGGFSNAYALKVSGPAQFWGGPVSFTGSVDFSNAVVSGLSGGVSAPLTLTGALSGPVLSASNTGTGNAAFFFGPSGAGVVAQGFTGVAATGSSIGLSASGGTGVYTQGQVGINAFGVQSAGRFFAGQGGGNGVDAVASVPNTTGLVADFGGGANSYAMKVSGPAQFWGGAVSFTSAVDFTGAAVTGLALTVPVPLTLTGATSGPVLSATNTGAGTAGSFFASGGGSALYAQGNPNAISATVSGVGTAIYAQTSGGGFKPAVQVVTSGTSHAVEGDNLFTGSIGMLAGDQFTGQTGVLGESFGGRGVEGEGYGGIGVRGLGPVGVEGLVTQTGQTALLGDYGGFANAYALKVSGPAQFLGGPVSFTGAVDFSGATVTGLGSALSVTTAVAWPAGVFDAVNSGSGYGVFGRATQAGTIDGQGHPLTINAGVYGYADTVAAAGVFGISAYGLSNAAGVVAIGPTGIFGNASIANGEGGSFQANSGTAVNAQGLNGIQIRSGTGGKGLEIQTNQPTDTALQIDGGASTIDGTVVVMANATSGTAILRVQQNQVNFGGNAIYGSTGASATAAVMGESFDTTPPNSQGTASTGVYGHGASGVIGQSSVPGGFGVIGTVDSGGNTNSVAVFATNSGLGEGVNAQGLTGTVSRAGMPGGLGLLASDGNQGNGALAFMASGGSIFNGPVTFTGAVSGLSFAVSAPLSLTAGLGGPIISGANTLSGPGVFGSALVANAAGVSGTNDVAGGLGVYGGSANGTGLFGSSAASTGYGAVAQNLGGGVALSATSSAGFGTAIQAQSSYEGLGAFGSQYGISVSAGSAGTSIYSKVSSSADTVDISNFGAGNGIIARSYGNGSALYAQGNATGTGLFATANSAAGVLGSSSTSWGVNGIGNSAGSGGGVLAQGVSVGLSAAASSATGVGVQGSGDWGVIANGQNAAVSATCSTANGWGVWTSSQAVGGKGVVAFGDSVGVAATSTNAAGIGVVASSPFMGLSATAAASNAVYARSGVTGIVGRTDSTSSFGVQGIGTGTGTGIQGTVAGGSGGSRGVQGSNAAVGGIGVEGTNTDASTGGGIGVNGLASHSASYGVMANNPSTLASYTAGAGLYVSGSVKTSNISVSDASTYSVNWAVNGGGTLPGGPAGQVRVGPGNTASNITTITFKNLLANTNSVVLITFVVAGTPPATYSVSVAAGGGCTIKLSSTNFASGDGFNFLIIN
jgi:hypothetical protein